MSRRRRVLASMTIALGCAEPPHVDARPSEVRVAEPPAPPKQEPAQVSESGPPAVTLPEARGVA
ncbi:MAG TPA: hypothetical protein VG755_02690, partial [Nannocystaceae bacterium]|nr:hypothetical protein [Nannocystaceae bacterium]